MSKDQEQIVVDFSGYEEEQTVNTKDVLGQITVLAQRMRDLDLEIANLEGEAKRKKEQREDIATHDLPELFHSVGQTELKTTDGIPLKLANVLRTNISKDRKSRAITWLDEHGEGAIVKRRVIVEFDKSLESKVQSLLNLIGRAKAWKNHRVERDVNAATVKALVKKRLEGGLELDKEVFGVYQAEEVKITYKK